jgi:hypothetical protein
VEQVEDSSDLSRALAKYGFESLVAEARLTALKRDLHSRRQSVSTARVQEIVEEWANGVIRFGGHFGNGHDR